MRTLMAVMVALLLLGSCSYRNAELVQRARAGDTAAQYEYGRRLLLGTRGCPCAPEIAVPWLRTASQGGDARAQALLGICCERGLGVPVSPSEARQYLQQSAQQGYAPACAEMMRLEASQGRGREAARWLRQLAEGEAPGAQLLYAKLCLSGLLGAGHEQEAVRYLRFAAMGGSREACLLLSACYAEGRGVPQNEELMQGWLQNFSDPEALSPVGTDM